MNELIKNYDDYYKVQLEEWGMTKIAITIFTIYIYFEILIESN